jgi:hypothetical protein
LNASVAHSQNLRLPPDQQHLIDLWNTADINFSNPANPNGAAGIEASFNRDLCASIPAHVSNWIGRVVTVFFDSRSGGLVVGVYLDPYSQLVSTGHDMDGSKIEPEYPFYRPYMIDRPQPHFFDANGYQNRKSTELFQGTQMHKLAMTFWQLGDIIEFSGDFIPQSLQPQYTCEDRLSSYGLGLFKFSSMTKLSGPTN